MRRRPGGEDGEVPGDVLARWDARGIHLGWAATPESARDERHHCLPSAGGCSRSIHGCSAIDRFRLSSLGGTPALERRANSRRSDSNAPAELSGLLADLKLERMVLLL